MRQVCPDGQHRRRNGAPALTSQGSGCLLASGLLQAGSSNDGNLNHSTDSCCQLLGLEGFFGGPLACLQVWSGGMPPAAWALHTSPHHQSHSRIPVSSGQLRRRPREWLHVVPLASALVESLTELDLRWALLGCPNAVLVFFLGDRRLVNCCTTSTELSQSPPNGNWYKSSWTNCTHRMDFQRKRSGSAPPALHRDGAGAMDIACICL